MAHILIVDADKNLRNTYMAVLETAGHSVDGAASAQGAIGACEDHRPDLIIVELQLQGHSGVEFLQELRSYSEWQGIPVVLHTLVPRADLQGFEQAFKSFGIVGYAYKPETTLKKLMTLVDGALTVKK